MGSRLTEIALRRQYLMLIKKNAWLHYFQGLQDQSLIFNLKDTKADAHQHHQGLK